MNIVQHFSFLLIDISLIDIRQEQSIKMFIVTVNIHSITLYT